MKLYEYNQITKEFAFESFAQIDPITKEPLSRNNATAIEPLKTKKGFAIVFNESSQNWKYVTDLRGQDSYNTETKQKEIINYLGEIKEGYTLLTPNDFDSWDNKTKKWVTNTTEELKKAKEDKLIQINNACNLTIISGFESSALGENHFYYSTLEEQSTLNSLILMGIDNLFKCQAIAINKDGVKEYGQRTQVLHTIEQLRQVLQDGSLHIGTTIHKKDELETQVAQATTKEELDLIKW